MVQGFFSGNRPGQGGLGGLFDRVKPKCADGGKPTCTCADGTQITR